MTSQPTDSFVVGDWLVSPQLNRIERNGVVRRLEPKVMEVLCFLAANPGSVSSRQAIFDHVWAGTVVTDDVLTRCISELRKAFGDTSRKQSIIETIPKTGYRIVADVGLPGSGATTSNTTTAVTSGDTATDAKTSTATEAAKWVVFVVLICVFSLVMWLSLRPPPPPSSVAASPFASAVGREVNPDLSPDGNSVAYAWTGEGDDNWDIYVRSFDRSGYTRITDTPDNDGSPTFSPDGASVAFIRYSERGCEIARVALVARTVTRVGSCDGTIYPDVAWSPDGQQLAYSGRQPEDTNFGIMLMSVADGTTRRATNPPASVWGDHDPSFSPKGRTIAFTRSASEGIQDIYLLDVRSGTEKRLTADARNILGHDWLPGGDDLLVATNRGGGYMLWRFPIDGTAPTPVFSSGSMIAKPTASQNGRVIVEQSQSDVNIWTAPVPIAPHGSSSANGLGTNPPAVATRLNASTRWDMHPALSPDGAHIAYTSNRTGSYEVWIGSREGGDSIQRTSFDGPFTGTPRWSPNGDRIAFDARPDGTADIFVLDAVSGAPRRLTHHPANDLAPSWSHDGNSIYFASTRSGAWEVWRIATGASYADADADADKDADAPPGSGAGDTRAVQVTTAGGFSSFESVDGRGLYFTRVGEPGLWFLNFNDNAETRLPINLSAEDWASWGVAGNSVYFLRRTGATEIVRYDAESEVSEVVFEVSQPVPHSDAAFSISADGKWIAWGQIDHQEVDLLSVGGK